ncbi:MAG: NUDIX hydrolase [Micrococcales bacterium]
MTSQPTLAVSTVIFALRDGKLSIPLVQRIRDPYLGKWALPGGPLQTNEDLGSAARRSLLTTTGLEPKYLEQLYAFGDPSRSPEQRVISIVYWALVNPSEALDTFDYENVKWFEADCLPELAFDHNLIVDYALWRLRNKLSYSRVAQGFLGERFTLAQLREVYETVLQVELDPGNFRRSIETAGDIIPTGERLVGGSHRPPMLYTYDEKLELADHGPLSQEMSNK